MNTREKIMDVALHMFSERGYEAVSIRDICGEVGIKESTLYYHFKNKKDILDSLVAKFRAHIDGLLSHVNDIDEAPAGQSAKETSAKETSTKAINAKKTSGKATNTKSQPAEDPGLQMVDSYMMDSYLFDPFCNLMLRLMMIEQFHNEEIRALYEKTMFTDPYEIQLSVFRKLSTAGVFPEAQVEMIVKEYHAYMTMLTYKYLLNGELTEARKKAYHKEVHDLMTSRFMA